MKKNIISNDKLRQFNNQPPRPTSLQEELEAKKRALQAESEKLAAIESARAEIRALQKRIRKLKSTCS
jgi:Skp family chaperone for outer membrane proteins